MEADAAVSGLEIFWVLSIEVPLTALWYQFCEMKAGFAQILKDYSVDHCVFVAGLLRIIFLGIVDLRPFKVLVGLAL